MNVIRLAYSVNTEATYSYTASSVKAAMRLVPARAIASARGLSNSIARTASGTSAASRTDT